MGRERTTPGEARRADLGTFLRHRRDAIASEWARAVGSLRRPISSAADLQRLIDPILEMVDAQAMHGERVALSGSAAERHAVGWLRNGRELREVVSELSVLREIVAEQWERSSRGWLSAAERRDLDRAIDGVLAAVADRYVHARDRLLVALDRVSATALEARGLDELLARLAHLLPDTLPSVDTVAILLLEGDRLRTRASVGLEDRSDGETDPFSVAIGEGFAGKVAATCKPIELASACTDPQVLSDAVRARRVRALYGVPLIADEQLLGVAQMGSLTTHSFSQTDRMILDTVAHRATMAICLHVLRERAEARSRELAGSERRFRAAFENSPVGVAHFDANGRFLRVNSRYREIVGFDASELAALTVRDLTHPDDRERARVRIAALMRGEVPSIHMEGRFLRKDGGVGWCDAFLSVVHGETPEDDYVNCILQDISGRKRAEEELRVGEERMRLAVQTTGLGTWDVDLESDSIVCSERTRRIIGIGPGEPIDLPRLLAMVPDQDRPGLEAAIAAALDPSSAGVLAHEHRIMRQCDGDERWLRARAKVTFDARARPMRVIGTLLDITDERRAGARAAFLAEASRMLASTLDLDAAINRLANLAVPQIADFCVLDLAPPGGALRARSLIAHADPAMERRIRRIYRRARARGGPIAHVLETGELLHFPILDETAVSALGPVLRELIREIDLRSFLAVPIFDHRTRVGVLTLGQTSRRRLSQEDVAFAVELASRAGDAIGNAVLLERANRAVRLREQILGIVSHDLRNPLGVVEMGGHLLAQSAAVAADPAARAQTERIRRAATRMSRLIRDLLDMSSIQAGRLALDRERHELTPILVEALESHAEIAKEKGVSLESELDVEGTCALVDRDRLLQVLANLLGNAIKFCHAGGHVVLRAERQGPELVIAVRDDGPGIAPEDQARVFDPYWYKSAAEHGTGLGLFISKGIITAHGGRIRLESRPGEGTTFSITLPITL